jgi:hypothetical protein
MDDLKDLRWKQRFENLKRHIDVIGKEIYKKQGYKLIYIYKGD